MKFLFAGLLILGSGLLGDVTWGDEARGQGVIDLLKTPRRVINLSKDAEILEDSSGVLDWAMALKTDEKRWQRGTSDTLEVAYTRTVWWVRLKFTNSAQVQDQRLIELRAPLIDFVDAYVLEGSRVLERFEGGDQRPLTSRPFPSRIFAFPLRVPPKEGREVLLRLALKNGVFDLAPLLLWKEADFWEHQHQEQMFFGGYFGAALALSLYHLLLFLTSGDRHFLRYALFLGGLGVWNFGYRGLGYLYLWRDLPWINNLLGIVIPSLLVLLSTNFVTHFLETRQRTPTLHTWIIASTLGLLVPGGMMLIDILGFDPPMVPALYLRNGLIHVLGGLYVVTGFVIYRQGFKPAGFFLLAWSCLIVGVWIYILSTFGVEWVPVNIWTENASLIGSTLEFQLLAMAVGYRYKLLRDQHAAMELESYRIRLRADIIDTISHELRTPLTVIQTTTQNLTERQVHQDADTHSRYEKILRAVDRMSDLVNGHLGRAESLLAQGDIVREPCDPLRILKEAAASAGVHAEGHKLIVQPSKFPAYFNCDPRLTALALRNLADNAVNYSPPRSTVNFRGGWDPEGLWFAIDNEAPGMTPELLAKSFEPGFRSSPQTPGSGHGLTLARSVIERQRGRLTGELLPGGRCSFGIFLPHLDKV